MFKAFEIAGYARDVVEARFRRHAERVPLRCPAARRHARPASTASCMLLADGAEHIREVIMFPMNQRAEDLMMGAPSEADARALRELHLRLVRPDRPDPAVAP